MRHGRWHRLLALLAVVATVAMYKALNGHLVLVVWDPSALGEAGVAPMLAEAAAALGAPAEAAKAAKAAAADAAAAAPAASGPAAAAAAAPASRVFVVSKVPKAEQAPAVVVLPVPLDRPTPPPPPPPPPPSAPRQAPAPRAGAGGCARPPPLGSLTAAPETAAAPADAGQALSGKRFAWCHDGQGKNGEFSFEVDGSTGGDFPKWNLKRWKKDGSHEVIIDDGSGSNVHQLVFNCDFTGFAVKGGRQRGYLLATGFESPESAGAPADASRRPECSAGPDGWSSSSLIPVWVWWDFRDKVPTMFRLNLRTWQRHISQDKFVLNLVNASNIRRFLPGIPEPFFRLYHAAKSDFLRAALIAVHGGVYLDGDMLISHDLDVIIKDLLDGKVDVLPYEGPDDRCPKGYTTNFMAGAKGNGLSSKWIEITMKKMVQQCDLPESENHREPVKVCCYQKDWCPRKECHVAWGDISHPPPLPDGVRMGCVPYFKGLAATPTGEELFYPLGEKRSGKRCWREGEADVYCAGRHLPGFFERHGHHLYNMLNGHALSKDTEEEVLASNTLVAELYRRSLGIPGNG